MRIGTLNNRYHALTANQGLDIAEASLAGSRAGRVRHAGP
jgi:hypothetical protein